MVPLLANACCFQRLTHVTCNFLYYFQNPSDYCLSWRVVPASTCVKELWLAISMHGRISRLQPFGNGISLLPYIVVHAICTYIVENFQDLNFWFHIQTSTFLIKTKKSIIKNGKFEFLISKASFLSQARWSVLKQSRMEFLENLGLFPFIYFVFK